MHGLAYLLVFPGVPIVLGTWWARRQARYHAELDRIGARGGDTDIDDFYRNPLTPYRRIASRNARAESGELGPRARELFVAQRNAWLVFGAGIFVAMIADVLLAWVLK